MAELSFNEIADRQLGQLERDPQRAELLVRVNEVLNSLEENPSDERLRRKEFRQLLEWSFCYAVEISGNGLEWVVLWTWHPDNNDEPVVIYIGAPPGG